MEERKVKSSLLRKEGKNHPVLVPSKVYSYMATLFYE